MCFLFEEVSLRGWDSFNQTSASSGRCSEQQGLLSYELSSETQHRARHRDPGRARQARQCLMEQAPIFIVEFELTGPLCQSLIDLLKLSPFNGNRLSGALLSGRHQFEHPALDQRLPKMIVQMSD